MTSLPAVAVYLISLSSIVAVCCVTETLSFSSSSLACLVFLLSSFLSAALSWATAKLATSKQANIGINMVRIFIGDYLRNGVTNLDADETVRRPRQCLS